MIATVVKSTGSNYTVIDESSNFHRAKIKGNLRLQGFEATNPVAAGDHVLCESAGDDQPYWITELQPRKNYIIRKSIKLSKQVQILAANVDRAWLVATPVFPKTSLGFIDRFLATCEAFNVPGGIIFNKTDLYNEGIADWVAEVSEIYKKIGYLIHNTSATTNNGIDSLKKEMQGKVNLLAGHSGVGKSSLLNALIPGLELKTAKISQQHLKGKHTTTFAEMHLMPSGGFVIDSPGIQEFGTVEFEKHEVSHYFPEIFLIGRKCKFNNCLHLSESNCAVRKAVDENEIAASRFQSYLSILENEDKFR